VNSLHTIIHVNCAPDNIECLYGSILTFVVVPQTAPEISLATWFKWFHQTEKEAALKSIGNSFQIKVTINYN